MKSAYKIAKEIGITSQAVYKRMTPEFLAQFEGHIFQGSEKSKRILFDEIGEQVLKAAFKKGEQQPDQPADRVDQPANRVNPLISQLQTENQYLRKAVTNLSDELKIEREHGRSQAVKLSALMDRYSKITENQQILLGREQGLNNPNLLLDGAQDKTAVSQKTVMEKVGFWHRLFGKKNSAKI
jgi:hypothetical protein